MGAIKSSDSEIRDMNDGIITYVVLWENPYIGMSQQSFNAKVGIFTQNCVITPSFVYLVSSLFIAWIPTSFLNIKFLVCSVIGNNK